MRKIVYSLFLVLVVVSFHNADAQEAMTGQISGKLMIKDGGPMSGGMVYFFNAETGQGPNPDKYWKVPDNIAEINDKGEFSVELHEGKYYMGGIKRLSGKTEIGPPQIGDFFYRGLDEKGDSRLFIVKKGENVDLGTISDAVPFNGLIIKDKITAIEGRVILDNDSPVEGALIFAYTSLTMTGRPGFVSDKTDKEGKFILRVHEGGSYYLRAREIYGGGPPVSGGIIGGYGEAKPISVEVKTGEIIKGIDIKVIKFPGRGPNQGKDPDIKTEK